jgi:hypothetical protein
VGKDADLLASLSAIENSGIITKPMPDDHAEDEVPVRERYSIRKIKSCTIFAPLELDRLS